jgi:hypothetical protein
MKNQFKNSLFSAFVLATTLLVVSCGPTSKKGAWTEADKKTATDRCNKEMEKMKSSADMKSLADMGGDVSMFGTKVCDCITKKIEADYESLASIDNAKMEAIGATCGEEIAKPMMEEIMKKKMAEEAAKTPDTTNTKKDDMKKDEMKKDDMKK